MPSSTADGGGEAAGRTPGVGEGPAGALRVRRAAAEGSNSWLESLGDADGVGAPPGDDRVERRGAGRRFWREGEEAALRWRGRDDERARAGAAAD